MLKHQRNLQWPSTQGIGKERHFKMQVNEIPDEQAHMWCLQELGFPSLLWTLVPCSYLSWSRFLGFIRSLLSRAGWGEVHVAQMGWDGLLWLLPCLQGYESLVMAGKRESFFSPAGLGHSATEGGWTGDRTSLQVWTHHDVWREGVAYIVFRISIDKIKVSTQ